MCNGWKIYPNIQKNFSAKDGKRTHPALDWLCRRLQEYLWQSHTSHHKPYDDGLGGSALTGVGKAVDGTSGHLFQQVGLGQISTSGKWGTYLWVPPLSASILTSVFFISGTTSSKGFNLLGGLQLGLGVQVNQALCVLRPEDHHELFSENHFSFLKFQPNFQKK